MVSPDATAERARGHISPSADAKGSRPPPNGGTPAPARTAGGQPRRGNKLLPQANELLPVRRPATRGSRAKPDIVDPSVIVLRYARTRIAPPMRRNSHTCVSAGRDGDQHLSGRAGLDGGVRGRSCSTSSQVLRSDPTSHARSSQACHLSVPERPIQRSTRWVSVGSPGSRAWRFRTCHGS